MKGWETGIHNGLVAEQEAVVLGASGPTLLMAGAGTGKTRTVVAFAQRLLTKGTRPHRILLTTFTRKAADELRTRLLETCGPKADKVRVDTLHAFAAGVLREEGAHVGIQGGFTVLDRDESKSILQQILKPYRDVDKLFPDASETIELFSFAANSCKTLERSVQDDFPEEEKRIPQLLEVSRSYATHKRAQNLMDFDDLLTWFHRLLTKDAHARSRLEEALDWIVVDEGHDTSVLQFETLRLLRTKNQNLLFIGDPSQSIYAWRASDPTLITRFLHYYPAAKTFRLSKNFRSTQPILDYVNSLIRQNSHPTCGDLVSHNYKTGPKPGVVFVDDEGHERQIIVDRILKIRSAAATETAAVLYRIFKSYPMHGRILQIELARHKLPFVVRGGQSYYASEHVRDALAFLRITVNPRDLTALYRVVLLLPQVGEKTAQRILAWESTRAPSRPSLFGVADRPQLPDAPEWYRRLQQWVRQCEGTPPAERLRGFIESFYQEYTPKTHKADAPRRLGELEVLSELAEHHQTTLGFLDECAFGDPVDRVKHQEGNPVVLSSVHQAKGLEWDHVFLPLYIQNFFPTKKGEESSLEEERRVAYVAQTRAKKTLTLLVPEFANSQSQVPSRFLGDVPSELYAEEYWTQEPD